MKKYPFLLALMVLAPTLALAQTQTRERKTGDPEKSSPSNSTAARERVVGPRVANHFEKKQSVPAEKNESGSSSNSNTATDPVNQSPQPTWGNTSVIIRPGSDERSLPTADAAVKKPPVGDQNNTGTKKLIQQTALAVEPSSPLTSTRDNGNSRTSSSPRAPVSTTTYRVGVGDVLDIRLANLPTRESTLFTVLKNGQLEYPLLNGPVSVGGLTTDEIAKLLSSEIKVIKSARVSVSVRDYASHACVVTGLVENPGRKTLRREAMPLYTVLAEAQPRAEASVATIVRAGKEEAISLSNEQAMSTLVLPGDVIKIAGADSIAKRFVYVGGDVATPGEKEYRDGLTLTQALLSAGGAARTTKTIVRVARRNAAGYLTTSEYNLQSIENGKSRDPVLEAGDRIEVIRGM